MGYDEAVEIAKDIYWVGFHDKEAGFHCNPYLVLDGNEAVLIDPGSLPHFQMVARKVLSVVNPKNIKYIILHHQDPDLCAGVPRFEDICSRDLQLVAAWRAGVLIAYYGTRSRFYYVDRNQFSLTLASGRRFKFIPTPFCHSPGSIVTYDESSKILFSSDLFGAFSFDWDLYAGEHYFEAMKAFHEPYMPSKEILSKNMERIERFDISMIAPQHGSIIRRERVADAIRMLKELDCGDFFVPGAE